MNVSAYTSTEEMNADVVDKSEFEYLLSINMNNSLFAIVNSQHLDSSNTIKSFSMSLGFLMEYCDILLNETLTEELN